MVTRDTVTRYVKAAVIILLPLLLIATSFVGWYFKPAKLINTVILDKTVPTADYREHKGLMWALNNLKVFDKDLGRPFKYDTDYYGFFPLRDKKYDIKSIPEHLPKQDLIYLADTYGVYADDFYTDNLRGNRSGLIYGGLTKEDLVSIKGGLQPNTLLISEFNTLATPTDKNTRQELEQLLGVKWLGWMGRYFKDLDKNNQEIPLWLVRNYEKRYQTKWTFTGPGVAFVRSDDTVFILQQDKELGDGLVSINFTAKAMREFDVKNKVKYYYWFDVVATRHDVETLATYQLDVNEAGRRLLTKHHLSPNFAAVTRLNSTYKAYYFAGDFSDIDTLPVYWNNIAQKFIKQLLTVDLPGTTNYFYWNVYYPLLEGALAEVTEHE